ncbi:MAG TPA: prepilin-type N-terminal cleavage/methylation domain-containing protein [Planctomycetota bacterium]|jgi:prepilin-type N-terminal cleavage/methylation domain-containing protein
MSLQLAVRPNARGTGRVSGFTLIEMLVVIAIILILIGILIPVIGTAQQQARKRATRTLIDGLAAGIERYNVQFGMYPPDGNIDSRFQNSSAYLLYYLCGEDRTGVTKRYVGLDGKQKITKFDPYVTVPEQHLTKKNGEWIIVDSWHEPISYLNCAQNPDLVQARASGVAPDPAKYHNYITFDIYSTGPDREVDSDPPDHKKAQPNDITNWSKIK